MNEKIKLVIFDLDGTLVDAYKAVANSMNYTLTQLNYPTVDDAKIKRTVGWGDRHLMGVFVSKEDLDRAISIFRQHHARALKDGTKFLPGAQSLLKDLKTKKFKLAVASNRPTRFTHIVLKHLNIHNVFDCVLCGDKVVHPKPAADILEETLRRLSLKAQEAIYVGDMTIDVETGFNAGIKTIAVVTGSSTREEIAALNPFKIIEEITDVKKIIENLTICDESGES